MAKKITAYVCQTAWEVEAGETDIPIYSSIADIIRECSCVRVYECKIVQLEVREVRTLSNSVLKKILSRKEAANHKKYRSKRK